MDGNIQKYKALLAAVDTGSITKAAESLNYTQSGISRMIGDLESEWRVTLLERRHAGVRLTSDGMQLIPHIRSICSDADKLLSAVDELNGLRNGLIRIGAFHGAGSLLAPVAAGFRKKYPGIDFQFMTGEYDEIEDWIATGNVDCGLTRLPVRKDLEAVFLMQDSFAAVLPENHPAAKNSFFPVASVEKEVFLMQQSGSLSDLSELFERCGVEPGTSFLADEEHSIPEMVENGLGMAILPGLTAEHTSAKVAVIPLDVPAYRNIGLALRNRKGSSLAMRRFLEYLQNL